MECSENTSLERKHKHTTMYNQSTIAALQYASPIRSNAGFRSGGNYLAKRLRRVSGRGRGSNGLSGLGGLGETVCPDPNEPDQCYYVDRDFVDPNGYQGGVIAPPVLTDPKPSSGGIVPVVPNGNAATCDPNVLYPTGSACGIAANVRELQQIVTNMVKPRTGTTATTSPNVAATANAGKTFTQMGADASAWVSKNSTMVATLGLGAFVLLLATSGGSKGRRR